MNLTPNTQHITPEIFEELVTRALEGLPDWVQATLDNVQVTIAAAPTAEQLRRMGLGPGRTLLGLYEGVPQTRRTHAYTLALPDKITLFRNPILSVCRTPREVQERVRAVVIHEMAHHFGIDDQRLRDLDAY
jgi:predicted Zn-dependent protease with MMP-like domain